MVFFDLSLSNVIFPFCFLLNRDGRSKCRKGVTKIASGQSDERSIVRFITVISTVLVKNIPYLPIEPNNCNSEECLVRMPYDWWQRGWPYRLPENGSKRFGVRSVNKPIGITSARARIAPFRWRSRPEICGNMPVVRSIRRGTLPSVSLPAEIHGCWVATVLKIFSL